MVHLGWSSCLFGKYITGSCPGTWAWCVFRVRCGALNAAFGKLGNFCLFMGLMPPLAVPVFKPTPSSAPKTSSGSNGPIDRKPRAPRRPRAIFASWNAKAPNHWQIACFGPHVWGSSAASRRVPGGWGLSMWPISVHSTPKQCRCMARAASAVLGRRPKMREKQPKKRKCALYTTHHHPR